MALWSRVSVNSTAVGLIEVQRLSPADTQPAAGDVCSYRWSVHTDRGRLAGELSHPYGDWVTLYAAVLEAAARLRA